MLEGISVRRADDGQGLISLAVRTLLAEISDLTLAGQFIQYEEQVIRSRVRQFSSPNADYQDSRSDNFGLDHSLRLSLNYHTAQYLDSNYSDRKLKRNFLYQLEQPKVG